MSAHEFFYFIGWFLVAHTNGPRNKLPMPNTTQNLPHTSSLQNSTNNSTITYDENDNGRPQCPASGTLLLYMSASGGLALVASLFPSFFILFSEKCTHCPFLLVLVMTPIHYLGKLNLNREYVP